MYLDIFFMQNIIMNFLLLIGCMYVFKAKKFPFVYLRITLSALFGAGSALLILLGNLWEGPIVNTYKIFSIVIMMLIAFGFESVRKLAAHCLIFIGISFAFAGAMTAIVFFDGSLGEIYNGVLYWRINHEIGDVVIAGLVVGIIIFTVYKTINEKMRDGERIVSLVIVLNGIEYNIEALVDTGNELKEPFSGRSAIIVEENKIPADFHDDYFKTRMRIVPYKSLGNENGALTGVIPDSVKVILKSEKNDKRMKEIDNVIVCLCRQVLSDMGKYQAIINYELLG